MDDIYLNYNGNIVEATTSLVGAGNRGLRYGDGLFETMRLTAGTIPFFKDHMQRLFQGMEQLGFTIPDHFTETHLQYCIAELCRKNNHPEAARVRLMIFRGNGTLSEPENNFPNYIIEASALDPAQPDAPGLVTAVFREARKTIDGFSHIKSNNYQPYMLTARYARKMGFGDAILLNTSGHICESSIANIFIIKDGTIITPSLAQGCIAGVMRKYLLTTLPGLGYKIMEDVLTLDMLITADEVFLTNSVQGIRRVLQTDGTFYTDTITTQIKHAIGY